MDLLRFGSKFDDLFMQVRLATTTFIQLLLFFIHNRRQLLLLKSLLHILQGATEVYGLAAIGRLTVVLG